MGRDVNSIAVRFGAVLGSLALATTSVNAQQQFNWNPALTGAQNWEVDGNWDQPGFPNASTHVANLSGPLASSLSVLLGPNTRTVAGLTLGGTAGAVSTNVSNGGIAFLNDVAAFNNGVPLVVSGGTPGSTNIVAVVAQLMEPIDFGTASTNNIVFSGLTLAAGAAPSIRSFMPAGLSANIQRLDITDPADQFNYRRFRLNDSAGSPAGMPAVSTQGTLEIGEITGYGELSIGVTGSQHPVPLGTVILNGPNSMVGYIQINRGNIVLAHDSALGGYGIFGGQPNQGVGFNFISTDDARTVSGIVELSQWFSIKGDHSLTLQQHRRPKQFSRLDQSVARRKDFTSQRRPVCRRRDDTERTYSFDGTGRTDVTGGLHDKYVFDQGPSLDGIGHFRKTGTGSVCRSSTVQHVPRHHDRRSRHAPLQPRRPPRRAPAPSSPPAARSASTPASFLTLRSSPSSTLPTPAA